LKIAYLTDVEGKWPKLESFVVGNPWVRFDAEGRLCVAPGARFVFGGDAVDRGPAARRIIRVLLEAKRRQPEQVVLLAGNRDINKMRLVTELFGAPPPSTPESVRRGERGARLRWIFEYTMGAARAFDHRADELALSGLADDDDAVVQSFLDDLSASGDLSEYLCACQLAHREDESLFVHGHVTEESMGFVPQARRRFNGVDDWICGLNEFYAEQCSAFRARDCAGYAALVAYQAPVPGTRLNQASVVYGRPTDELGNPFLPLPRVIEQLRGAGIRRVVVGHTPSGDCPTLLRDGAGFELLLADNSHGRIECGAQLLLDDDPRFTGESVLDSGERVSVVTRLAQHGSDSPLGLCDARGRLVKARLERGDYLTFRGLSGFQIEQHAIAERELVRPLGPPRAQSRS